MKRALLILSRGFEEIEAVTPLDLLRRAGLEVVSASAGAGLLVEGGRGVRVQADRMLDECLSQRFDMVILPGGPGVDDLRKDARVLDLVRRAHGDGVALAAICAATVILADAGVASGHVVTSFPSRKEELQGRVKAYSEQRVVQDGKVITSRGAGSSEEFALNLIAFLLGPVAAQEVRARIVAR
ncbi:MAG TPA: DJ-1 family glyoxalase III [Fibrobacteria bacterium]|nr:DJ-1 family glyoxalase III [Fibrobacteria bacterium]